MKYCNISSKFRTHSLSNVAKAIVTHFSTIRWFLILHYPTWEFLNGVDISLRTTEGLRFQPTPGVELYYPYRTLVSWVVFLGTLILFLWIKHSITSFGCWTHSISNIVVTITTISLDLIPHYIVWDGAHIFLNFLVVVRRMYLQPPPCSGLSSSF